MSLVDVANNIKTSNNIELLPHNQMLYDKITAEVYKGEHSIFYSEGTGLGKSFVFMKLVKDFFEDARVLYIVPKIAIWDNITHYKEFEGIASRVTMMTFTAFNRYPSDNISCADYDVVFVDECHHMLSDVQGKNVKQFLDDMVSWDKWVFGMTATPEIEGTFVDEECFDVSCYGLDMFEAIEQGLMPKMDIAIGIKEEIDIPSNLREQYSVVGTKTLLETVIDDYKHVTHWLAYFTTKDELEQGVSELRKLFPEFKILKAYHGLDNTIEVISEFEISRQPVILMTVSMFLEGMHLENVGGVLLYRNVQKSHTYAQILGRLCVIGQKYTPVIVDIPGSIITMKQFYVPKSNRVSESHRKVYERKDIFDVTSRGYELLDMMTALELFDSWYWSEVEDNIIREYYPTEGAEVITRLPKRTKDSIRRRAFCLGVQYLDESTYTEEELSVLLKNGAIKSVSELRVLLPNRSEQSIRNKLKKLGIEVFNEKPRYDWTTSEEEKLVRLYEAYGPRWSKIVQELGDVSRQQVIRKASLLGLQQESIDNIKWTEYEDSLVLKYYGKDNDTLMSLLPKRSWSSIKGRARKLSATRGSSRHWSEDEIALLKEVYPKYGLTKTVESLQGRTLSQVRSMVGKLKLIRERREG